MAATITERGRLYKVDALQSGETSRGGTWYRQNIIVEVTGAHNSIRRISLEASGDTLVRDLQHYKEGDAVSVNYYVSAREGSGKWQGRWFNDVVLVSIGPAELTYGEERHVPQTVPAGQVSGTSRPLFNENGESVDEDLPF